MTHWFLPQVLSDEALQASLQGHELVLPSEGMYDLARTQEPDQIADWLKRLHPEASPEYITTRLQHFWRLGHELLSEDTVVVRVKFGSAYLIGEISGAYRREERAQGMSHVWPVEWRGVKVPSGALPALEQYASASGITEITDEEALRSLGAYIPTLRKGNAALFRWLAIGTLIFELIYFWPHG